MVEKTSVSTVLQLMGSFTHSLAKYEVSCFEECPLAIDKGGGEVM